VGSSDRRIDAATRRARASLLELGDEARRHRIEHGLSQARVARAVGVSRAQVGRIERGETPNVSVRALARLLAAVGMDLSVRAYPGGEPIRDAAHVALLRRLRQMAGAAWAWTTEVAIGPAGDRRAWDATISHGGIVIGVEAETRVRDLQAVLRRVTLKQHDSGVSRVVLLLADTRSNRRVVREFAPELHEAFPVQAGLATGALRAGTDPGGNAIVLL
jgi:transcriptional regulator with XRE-family HTH domain